MRAAYYERNGSARDVLKLGEIETPRPVAGEVRVKLAASGVNPSDVKARAGATRKIAYPRVIPHSDGAGIIDMVGAGVPSSRIGERVWVWNAQWLRAIGTCAEYVALPAEQAVRLPENTSFEVGACLGSGQTAGRAPNRRSRARDRAARAARCRSWDGRLCTPGTAPGKPLQRQARRRSY
jgi:NADPH2:quinone reductase